MLETIRLNSHGMSISRIFNFVLSRAKRRMECLFNKDNAVLVQSHFKVEMQILFEQP